MTGIVAIVAGVVFVILVVRRLVAGDSDEAFGDVEPLDLVPTDARPFPQRPEEAS